MGGRARALAEKERAEASAKARLEGVLASALARFGGAEPQPPPLPPDRAAKRQERGVLLAPPTAGRVSRAELSATLNETSDPRIAAHITRCREQLASDEELAPHRRPVSTADTPQTKIHREARVMASAIVNSRGAYVIQAYLRKLRPIFSGQPLALLRAAALEPLPTGGFRWTYADECARRRIAEGLLFLVCGRWTSQRTAFGSRSSRRGLVIAGMSVDRILRAVTPVGRKAYDRHTFSSRTNRWLGDMARFEAVGFAVRKRLPPWRCNPWEIGSSGQSKNRYWIGCVVSNVSPKREARSRPVTALGAVLGAVAFDPAAHHVGWEWAAEVPSYAPD